MKKEITGSIIGSKRSTLPWQHADEVAAPPAVTPQTVSRR